MKQPTEIECLEGLKRLNVLSEEGLELLRIKKQEVNQK